MLAINQKHFSKLFLLYFGNSKFLSCLTNNYELKRSEAEGHCA